jgi:hypothetical protein
MFRPIDADGTSSRSTGNPSREYAAAVGMTATPRSPGSIAATASAVVTRRAHLRGIS